MANAKSKSKPTMLKWCVTTLLILPLYIANTCESSLKDLLRINGDVLPIAG